MRNRSVAAMLAMTLATTLLATTESVAAAGRRTAHKQAVVLTTRKLPKLGTVLVNGTGRTLYIFWPDAHKKVTCTSTCASIWPPLTLSKGAKPRAAGAVKRGLIGSDPTPGGGRVVTYNGWPLYAYVGDGGPGTANGQAVKLDGGLWYVISPAGRLIRTKLQ